MPTPAKPPPSCSPPSAPPTSSSATPSAASTSPKPTPPSTSSSRPPSPTHSIPIVCVGEKLEEREANLTNNVLELQVSIALEGIDPATATPIVFAYEPVWAIGTGRTATPEIAQEAHKIIRNQIAQSLTPALAASTRILYGGSVKPDNAKSLCCLEDIDGALVGGASLEPQILC